MEREKTDTEILQEVEGIGPKRSEALVSHFGSGGEVKRSATSSWGRVSDVEGISEDTAREMFDRMGEAGVRDELDTRSRMPSQARGVVRRTDIGREADGQFNRPDTNPDIRSAPIAREDRSGRFGLDPFDIGTSTAGSGGTNEQFGRFDATPEEEAADLDRIDAERQRGVEAVEEFNRGDMGLRELGSELEQSGHDSGGFLNSPPELTEGDDPFLVGNPGEFNSPYKSKDKDKYD